MAITLAFDVYGTLIDTHGVVTALTELVGDKAKVFSQTWRDKQLEYSFRRGLMQNYVDFSVCTKQALDYTCAVYKTDLNEQSKSHLLGIYRVLPAFKDVKASLSKLQTGNYRLFALSNGLTDAVDNLLVTANIRDHFLDIVSADELKTFKPNPEIYRNFLKRTGSTGKETWLISGNPFDVIGAISAGMKAAWVKRSEEMVFDPWEIQPTITIKNLSELEEGISNS